ncbi:MAG: endonuclease domain-containing protein [Bacteroidota bacterium]
MKNNKPFHYNSNSKTFENAKALKKNQTNAEKLLWQVLRGRQLNGTKFRRQHPIEKFIVDFYCHEYKLVIELDGDVHDVDFVKEYDEDREGELKNLGLKIIRFKNEEVFDSLEKILETIKIHCSTTSS